MTPEKIKRFRAEVAEIGYVVLLEHELADLLNAAERDALTAPMLASITEAVEQTSNDGESPWEIPTGKYVLVVDAAAWLAWRERGKA